jgi:hypothetical protein
MKEGSVSPEKAAGDAPKMEKEDSSKPDSDGASKDGGEKAE